MDQQQIDQLQAEESMFVQTAEGITSDGTTLTLRGVTASTLYFSDRPQRVVGHRIRRIESGAVPVEVALHQLVEAEHEQRRHAAQGLRGQQGVQQSWQ